MPTKRLVQVPLLMTEQRRDDLKAISARTGHSQQYLLREALETVLNKHARPATDDVLGMTWWNGLSEAERSRWLDIAWRRNAQAAGRISYNLDDMPSAADAWAAFKTTSKVQS
jgi:hypothetical protein